jgi:mRNA-degrading endonuclease RelE of RelBE toxin-antitoxin system
MNSPFVIEFTSKAVEDLRWFKKSEQRLIISHLESQLIHDPVVETRNRKRLRPNRLAEWELRVGRFRIFFDMELESHRIKIEAVGYKTGNRIMIQGEEYKL